jgi:Tol biopolymer transport system component
VTTNLREQLQQHLAGAYTLERELGGGGMSHVFVADDTELGRKVVVKVLRGDLTEGLSAQRFKREVRVAARLQHPHIAPLLTAGSLDGAMLYYTMPFVEGESLRARLERDGALPIADVMQLLRDIASALAYAHRQGVIHRDIKPENILLPEGNAVVADFGIAKAIQAARSEDGINDDRHSTTLTGRGMSLGTPAYMAPEQSAGDGVDQRADLYALGVVAYEMLAGRAPFQGRTAQRLIAAHATEAPEPIERLRPNVPPGLATLVMCLLEKQPADRPQTADDVLRTLNALVNGQAAVSAPRDRVAAAAAGWRRRIRDPLVLGLVLVAAASLVSVAALIPTVLTARRSMLPAPRARLTLDLPADARFNPSGLGSSMAFSPDGSTLAYVGGAPVPRLYLRRLDDLKPRLLAGTEGAQNPQFSADGQWIGFVTDFVLRAVPAGGGTVVTITNGVGRFTWGADGTIVFSKPSALGVRSGLFTVRIGGAVQPLTETDSGSMRYHGGPTLLPDGKTVLFAARSPTGVALGAVRLDSRQVVSLGLSGGSPLYIPGGYLLFTRGDGTLSAVRFDAERLRVVGEPVTVLDSIAMKSGGAAELALAPNGTLVYLPGTVGRELVEFDRTGVVRPVTTGIQSLTASPRVSPDGRRIAVTVGQPPFSGDIWVYDIPSGTLPRLSTGGTGSSAEWSPDGRRIAWTSIVAPGGGSASSKAQDGVWWQPWDASAPPELLVPGAQGPKFVPRGDSLLVNVTVGNATEVRLVGVPYDAARGSRMLLPAAAGPRQARVSPDGRWLAYVSEETGRREVYVQPFAGGGGHFPISSGGGAEPVWNRNGKELFYRNGVALMAATISLLREPIVLRRDTLFTTDTPIGATETTYDVMPDGRHFIMTRTVTSGVVPVLVFGWADEVRERVAAVEKR